MHQIETTLLQNGWVEFADVVPAAVLAELNEEIDKHRAGTSRFKHALDNAAESFVERLRRIDRFREHEANSRRATRALAAQTFPLLKPSKTFYVLRCVDSRRGAESHKRHFDSHLMTLLVPLKLAAAGHDNGDLVFYARTREDVSTWSNLRDKIANRLGQSLPFTIRAMITHGDLTSAACMRIRCTPGNIYLFNGFRTQHCNLHVTHGERRSLLIHDYDPGLSLGLSTVNRRLRAIRNRLTLS